MNILVLGEYLTSHAGGAEKSTISIIKDLSAQGHKVTVLCARQTKFKRDTTFHQLLEKVNVYYLDSTFDNLPPFIRYSYNKFTLRLPSQIRLDFYDQIIIYDLWGKSLMIKNLNLISSAKIKLYVRSEVDYLVYRNYQKGIKRFLWYVQYILQYPFFSRYCKDIKKLAKKGFVVSNSVFVQNRVYQKLGTRSEVKLPTIDIEDLKRRFKNTPKYVVFIGDSKHKGLEIFYRLTSSFPELKFKCFARNPPKELRRIENVVISDWVDDPILIYNEARLVIVPSQWEEAFGRVAREAYDLGVPVLCSKIGGLTEAVRYDSESLVENYKSITAWEKSVKCKILSSI